MWTFCGWKIDLRFPLSLPWNPTEDDCVFPVAKFPIFLQVKSSSSHIWEASPNLNIVKFCFSRSTYSGPRYLRLPNMSRLKILVFVSQLIRPQVLSSKDLLRMSKVWIWSFWTYLPSTWRWTPWTVALTFQKPRNDFVLDILCFPFYVPFEKKSAAFSFAWQHAKISSYMWTHSLHKFMILKSKSWNVLPENHENSHKSFKWNIISNQINNGRKLGTAWNLVVFQIRDLKVNSGNNCNLEIMKIIQMACVAAKAIIIAHLIFKLVLWT